VKETECQTEGLIVTHLVQDKQDDVSGSEDGDMLDTSEQPNTVRNSDGDSEANSHDLSPDRIENDI